MANEKKRHGETDALQVRRVGLRHVVVTPARTSTVVDVNTYRNRVERLGEQIAAAERAREQSTALIGSLTAEREQVRGFLLAFDALPIDRIDGDPDVPLEAPKPDDAPVPAEPGPGRPQRG